jgi:hypothetical protein
MERKTLNHLTRIKEVLKMVENGNEPTDQDLLSSLLPPDVPIISANEVLKDVQDKLGIEIGKEFMSFVLGTKMPEHKLELLGFFENRNDVVSLQCKHKLSEESK